MALRVIRTEEDEILRKICKPVTEINDSVLILLDDMAETLEKSGNGVGIAAPQVGILKRIVVINIGDGAIELINPEITLKEGEQIGLEGCLSLPELFGEVKRPNKVKVVALDRYGNKIEKRAEGFLARVICHEVDHLNGILFKDLATKFVEVEGKDKK